MFYRIVSLLGPDKVPLADKFMSALDCFSQPDQEFKVSSVDRFYKLD